MKNYGLQDEINNNMIKNMSEEIYDLNKEIYSLKRTIENDLPRIECRIYKYQYPDGNVFMNYVQRRSCDDWQYMISYEFVHLNSIKNILIEFSVVKPLSYKIYKSENEICIGIKFIDNEKFYTIDKESNKAVSCTNLIKLNENEWKIL